MSYPLSAPFGLLAEIPSEDLKAGHEFLDGGERVVVLANYGILDAPGHPQDGRMAVEVRRPFSGYEYMTGVPVGTVNIFNVR